MTPSPALPREGQPGLPGQVQDHLVSPVPCLRPSVSEAPNKEQVYDEKIAPLMLQIIDICKAHGIAMLCTFDIPTPEDDDLACTSMVPNENGENPASHRRAYREIRGHGQFAAFTITSPKDGAAGGAR